MAEAFFFDEISAHTVRPVWDNRPACFHTSLRFSVLKPNTLASRRHLMKHLTAISAALLCLTFSASAQTLSNDAIQARINSLHAERSIAVTFDAAGKTTKIMAVSENFSKDEAGRSGILAMNFAAGLIYPGDYVVKSPESFRLTFCELSKKQ